ncbi:MAG: S4 domain-containing protein YaaA [Mycoplasmataceae bacterium]|jgi:S4 domain protein YaaA|nr:S4 domain-containing protein YaaA [Mycoplasmataceae bacterium]
MNHTVPVYIKTPYITLGQFLKYTGIAPNGGQVKTILHDTPVMVNGVIEQRRGKKLYVQDQIQINATNYQIQTKG